MISVDRRINLKVLIADDHFLTHEFVRNALYESNITDIQHAADGNEAIDLVQKARDSGQPYDIVFLDWNMPMVSGLDVLSYFRAKPEYADTAFVMLTAESEQQNIMKAIKSGATAYIIKPVSATQLEEKMIALQEWIKRNRPISLHTINS
jgi:two-component system chemotaxis response regulator CheY